MPRTYKPKAGARKYTVGQDEVRKAFADIQNGLSERAACEKHNISRTKLRNFKKMQIGEQQFRPPGGQTVLSALQEQAIVDHLLKVSEWGFPFDMMDLRMCVKRLLDKDGVDVSKFNDNLPGEDWASGFMRRHKQQITNRMCQNISKKRAGVGRESVSDYFDELAKTLDGVPPENIINYDETNLTDDPGRKKLIFKRGSRYPERILNSSKSSTSLMLAGTASGTVLPLYVVYKSEHMWDTWREGGPARTRYNRSKSGWFDHICFFDWFNTVALPYCKRLEGKKVLIGDNLSSHFSNQILQECERNNIAFVCMPPNSTHLCQPLDVAFFAPMKKKWRQILTNWKQSERKTAGTVPKDMFPRLLKKLMSELGDHQRENLIAGFRKCGIHPLDPSPVLNRLPRSAEEAAAETDTVNSSVSEVFIDHLNRFRHGEQGPSQRGRRRRVNVVPGRSVAAPEEEAQAAEPAAAAETHSQSESSSSDTSDTESSDDEIAENTQRNIFDDFEDL